MHTILKDKAFMPKFFYATLSKTNSRVLLIEWFDKPFTVWHIQNTELVKETFDALLEVHGCGIHHMDIKPEHLKLDSKGHIKIIDWDAALSRKDWYDASFLRCAYEFAKKGCNMKFSQNQRSFNIETPKFLGTPQLCSLAQHIGSSSYCWIDIQSLCFSFYYMEIGKAEKTPSWLQPRRSNEVNNNTIYKIGVEKIFHVLFQKHTNCWLQIAQRLYLSSLLKF
jgi:serine/threonine protein kinase